VLWEVQYKLLMTMNWMTGSVGKQTDLLYLYMTRTLDFGVLYFILSGRNYLMKSVLGTFVKFLKSTLTSSSVRPFLWKNSTLNGRIFMKFIFECFSKTFTENSSFIKIWQKITCRMLSSGLFYGVCSLNANVSQHSVCSISIGEWVWSVTAVENVRYYMGKGLARKIAWSPPKDVVGVGAGRENRSWRYASTSQMCYVGRDVWSATLSTTNCFLSLATLSVLCCWWHMHVNNMYVNNMHVYNTCSALPQ
jgi:hypothetical protein